MPARSEEFKISVHHSARSLGKNVWEAIHAYPRTSNLIAAKLLKMLAQEQAGGPAIPDQFWIVYETNGSVDLILACTEGDIRSYPIFIFSARTSAQLDDLFLRLRIERLVRAVHNTVSTRRVFSVFSLERITTLFVEIWSQVTQIAPYPDPYYAAKLTYVTKYSLENRSASLCTDFAYELLQAVEDDIPQIAPLFVGFSQESVRSYIAQQYIPLTQFL
jgi:hypothetical protein